MSGIWLEVLDAVDVEPDTNFFDAGGSSLTMARVQIALRQRYGISLSLTDLFANATVRKMVELLLDQGAWAGGGHGARHVEDAATEVRGADAQ